MYVFERFALACLFATLLGCSEKPDPSETRRVVPTELTLEIELNLSAKAVRFTLHNGSPDPVIVAIRQPWLIAYVIRAGKRLPITWDASNADMGRLDPLGCVLLQAGDEFERSLPLWTNLSGEIRPGEKVVGVTPRITIQSFDGEQQKQFALYKQYFLGEELRSPEITVSARGRPLTALDSNEFDPAWSPDGKQICVSSDLVGKRQLHVFTLNSLPSKLLTPLIN